MCAVKWLYSPTSHKTVIKNFVSEPLKLNNLRLDTADRNDILHYVNIYGGFLDKLDL